MEVLGKGDPVPYTRAVEASTAKPPEPSRPEAKRERVAELLGRAGHSASQSGGILAAVDAWRRERVTPMASVKALGQAVIAHFDALCAKNLVPHLPPELATVPRANIDFMPIKDAWFSGSMNYIGRARTADRRARVRSQLRDQRVAANFLSRIRAARQPRGCARPRDDFRLPAGFICARQGRL